MNPFELIVTVLSGFFFAVILINFLFYNNTFNNKLLIAEEVNNVVLISLNLINDYSMVVNYPLSPGNLVIDNDLITISRDESFSAANPGIKPVNCSFNSHLVISKGVVICV